MGTKEEAFTSQVSRGLKLFCMTDKSMIGTTPFWFVALISEAGESVQLNILLWHLSAKCSPRTVGHHIPDSFTREDLLMTRKT